MTPHLKTGGTSGTSGTASNGAGFPVPAREKHGGTAGTTWRAVPAVPARFTAAGTPEAAPLLAVPAVPAVPDESKEAGARYTNQPAMLDDVIERLLHYGEKSSAQVATGKPAPALPADGEKQPVWRLKFTNRDPVLVYCVPAATEAELLLEYPDAESLEPVEDRPSAQQPGSIRLASAQQPGAAPGDGWPADDRITCRACANLRQGACLAGQRGQLEGVAPGREYRPPADVLRRCEGFLPLLGASDQRTGAERWPGLVSR